MTNIPLSDSVLTNFLKCYPEHEIIAYEALKNYNTLEELFNRDQEFIIIFNSTPKAEVGHWSLLLNYPDRYEHFDSIFGGTPDAYQTYTHQRGLLAPLAKASAKHLHYSNRRLQSIKSDTCGRWISDRILKMKWMQEQYFSFYEYLKAKYKDLDKFIVGAIAFPSV